MALRRSFAKCLGRGESGKFDDEFFNKYATQPYYLSRGAFGNVYGPIHWKKTKLAIKQSTFADGKVTEQIKKDIEAKIDIWTSLEHKHLMKIYSVHLSQLPKVMFIVMEFAGGGSLYKTLRTLGKKNGRLTYGVITYWSKQIAAGMLYLHEKSVVHRDLKSSNTLLMEPFDTRNPEKMITLKIADFDEVKEHNHTATMSFVGTFAYMAPEVLRHQWYSKFSDVWSYGVVVWEMLSGDIPHKDLEPQAIMSKSIIGQLDNLPMKQSFPEEFQLLLNKCWKSNYEERPSFHDILCFQDPKDEAATENRNDSGNGQLKAHLKKSEEEREAIDDFQAESLPGIIGLAVMGNEMFISRQRFSYIEIYDSTTLEFKRYINVNGMTEIENMASCSVNNCIYTLNWDLMGELNTILKIDPTDGHTIKTWPIDGRGGLLSVASDTNVIATTDHSTKLHEFTADGVLIRIIDLGVLTQIHIFRVWYAVKLDDGQLVVCYGCNGDPINRVGLLSIKANSEDLGRTDEVEIQKEFLGSDEESIILDWPMYVSVNKEKLIMVSDQIALLLNSDLEKPRTVYDGERGMGRPWRTCFDESTGQWFLSDNHHIMVCRIEGENVEVKLYDPRLKAWILKSLT